MVVEVRHLDLGTRHALKVLQIHSPWLYDRLLTEGRIQATLRDRHVCRVTDVIRVGDAPGLVMELIEGPPLELLLANYQPNLNQIDALARGILAGVCAAHASGLVHRDLKPANILLEIDASDPSGFVQIVPKVADYGLAKTLGEIGSGGKNATRSGMTLGTPCYMAPEQFRNAKRADHRADQFSIGCILYELVSGMRPFDGETPIEIYESSSAGRFRPVREVAPSIPGRMADTITRALAPSPDARFPDCAALLEAWCDGVEQSALSGAWEPEHITLVRSLVRAPLLHSTTSIPDRAAPSPGLTAVPPEETHPPVASSASSEIAAPSRASAPSPPKPPALDSVLAPSVASIAGLSALALLAGIGLSVSLLALVLALWLLPPDPLAEAALPIAPLPPPSPAPEAPAPPVSPAPPAPAPAVAPPAPARPTPPRPAAPTATVSVRGVERAWLVDSDGRQHKPGPLPAGSYILQVFFDPTTPTRVLTLELAPNQQREIQCETSLRICR